jgi:hypothetical protein
MRYMAVPEARACEDHSSHARFVLRLVISRLKSTIGIEADKAGHGLWIESEVSMENRSPLESFLSGTGSQLTVKVSDGDDRSCFIRLEQFQGVEHQALATAMLQIRLVDGRDEEWLCKYALQLSQETGHRYSIEYGDHHEHVQYFILRQSIPVRPLADAVALVGELGADFLYYCRGLDDLGGVEKEQFRCSGYPTPEQVLRWLGPSTSYA